MGVYLLELPPAWLRVYRLLALSVAGLGMALMSSYANSGRRAIDAATFLKGKASRVSTVQEKLDTPLAGGEQGHKAGLTAAGRTQGHGAKETEGPGRTESIPDSSSASGASEPVSEQSPPLIFKDTTPSGIVVEYQSQPKRLYRVNGVESPSVTTVLEVLSKPGLKFWGQDVGVRAIMELFDRGKLATILDWSTDHSTQKLVTIGPSGLEHHDATFESLKALITAEKLSCNHVLTKAGDRGTNVHAALESWARSGGEFAPTPQNFNDEERPYVEAFLSWLDACDGAARPVQCEVMVGSGEHGFAGRYDLVIELTEPREFVYRALKKPKTVVVQPGRLLVDLKSSSGIYPTSHYRQLAAYELASIEGGYPKTDGQFVLHVSKHGTYQFVQSTATADDFLAVLRTWQSDRRLTGK